MFRRSAIRVKANAEALLLLKNGKYVQAIAMVARSLFELAVDVKLINVIPEAVKKMAAFSDVEKLRAAKKIVKFKNGNPTAAIDASIVIRARPPLHSNQPLFRQ